MTKRSFAAVIFDMDGTLVDSERAWPRLVGPFFASQVPDWNQEKFLALTGLDMESTYRLLKEFGARFSHAEFLDFCQRAGDIIYSREVEMFPGVKQLLAELHAHPYKMALGTSSPRKWADIVLDRFALRPWFQAVATASDVARGKPAPDIFLTAAERLGVAAADCLVVEDSLSGIAAAKAAGMYCVAVAHTYPVDRLTQADVVLPDILSLANGRWQNL